MLDFFSVLYVMSDIFFQEFICMLFSSQNQSAGDFF